MKNKPQNNPQKKVTKIVLVDAFTFTIQHDNLEASGELKSLSLTADEYVISASILVFLYIHI